MPFSTTEVQQLAEVYFQLKGSIRPLSGEVDLNFLLETEKGERFCFKIAHPQTAVADLEFQNAMMEHLQAAGLGWKSRFPWKVKEAKKSSPINSLAAKYATSAP